MSVNIVDKRRYKKKGEAAKPLSKPAKGKAKPVQDDDFEQPAPTEDKLQSISLQARKAVALEKQIADLEAAILSLKTDRDQITNKILPSLLESANMTDFTLDDGSSIEIKDVVSGSLPSADKKPKERLKALGWLMKNGGKGIIKTNFFTEFGVGQEKLVQAFEKVINKGGFAAKKSTGVHPQTLAAFVREKLENGEKVPIEMLGIYVGRHARIKLSEQQASAAEKERVRPKRRKDDE